MDTQNIEIPEEGDLPLPNGYRLYWKPDGVGGREYYSDEVGGGVRVWITSLVDFITLLTAVNQEQYLRTLERVKAEREKI